MEHNGIALEQAMVEALEALEGMAGRVCPVVDTQKDTGPLAVYDQREEGDKKTLAGNTGLCAATYQVHVLHNTYFAMRKLAESIKAALEALQGYKNDVLLIEAVSVELGTPDIHEVKVQMFRRTYNVNFQYQIKEE